jgi:hypothetical protein
MLDGSVFRFIEYLGLNKERAAITGRSSFKGSLLYKSFLSTSPAATASNVPANVVAPPSVAGVAADAEAPVTASGFGCASEKRNAEHDCQYH